jgi:hypothetical protein
MKWIKVKDKLPKEYKDVLVLMDHGHMDVSHVYEVMGGEFRWWSGGNVTHWRKLPNRPNKGKNEL